MTIEIRRRDGTRIERSQYGIRERQDVTFYLGVLEGYRGPRSPYNCVNNCTHTRTSLVSLPYKSAASPPGAGYDLSGCGGDVSAYRTLSGSVPRLSVSLSFSPAERSALMNELAGEIPPVVSVPNMLLELPQTLNLWHDLKKPLMALMSDRGVRKKWRAGSNALLSQQFGFLPLMDDIKKLVSSKRSVHSELQRITAEQSGRRRFSRKISRGKLNANLDLYPQAPSHTLTGIDISCEGKIFGWTRPTRYLSCDANTASELAGALYGWNRPLSTLWEATPFSFVYDWFLPVGSYLSGLEKSSFGGRLAVEALGTCTSCVASGTVVKDLGAYQSPRHVEQTRVIVRQFIRSGGFPPGSSWDDLTIPGIKQCILGGALLLQR